MLVHPNRSDRSKSRQQLGWLAALALACLVISIGWACAGVATPAHAQPQNGPSPHLVLDTATSTATSTVTTAASPSPTCNGAWQIVGSPNPCCGSDNGLNAIDFVSASDIWAVGHAYPDLLTEHWDGSQWSIVPTPPINSPGDLVSVAVVSSNDVWAVGGQNIVGGSGNQTLVLHWNGIEWSVSPGGTMFGDLYSVTAISANDIWAVGNIYYNQIDRRPLTMHWDGTTWSVVPVPTPQGSDSLLKAVAAVASNDVWAVGCCDGTQGVTAHWDGSAWTLVPNIEGSNAILQAVAGLSSNDVWAAGISWTTFQDITMHWDGTQWTQVPSLNIGGGEFNGLSALAPDDIWGVGYSYNNSGIFSAHWDGQHWHQVPVQWGVDLGGVVALSPQNVWAVGVGFTYPTGYSPLVEQYTSTCPNATSTSIATAATTATPTRQATTTVTATETPTSWPSATSTLSASSSTSTPSRTPTYSSMLTYTPVSTRSNTPVETSVPPTRTPTSTSTPTHAAANTPTNTPTGSPNPTPCSITFSDVPEGSTFYPYIRCLACRGIVSGYGNGTFGPGNPVTRGQLSKIVSNSAGYTETFSTNTFEDVPVGSTFFAYVERLYLHGGIQGYACGGPGEPCNPPDNKPYFRPGANVTRGQTSKIVAVARNLPPPPQGQQTFQDVPVDSTFWAWVESLASTGAIGGYPCGGPGEECVPPDNRPYFRPGANVTRGQSAKIVANAFFPGCQPPQSAAGSH